VPRPRERHGEFRDSAPSARIPDVAAAADVPGELYLDYVHGGVLVPEGHVPVSVSRRAGLWSGSPCGRTFSAGQPSRRCSCMPHRSTGTATLAPLPHYNFRRLLA
jgi:hypothetical protein